MGKALAFVWVAAVAAAPVFAQDTTCYRVGTNLVCHQPGRSPGVDWGTARTNPNMATDALGAFERGRQARDAAEQERREEYAEAERQQEANYRRQVNERFAAGDCEGARWAAINTGDFALVQQVIKACPVPAQ